MKKKWIMSLIAGVFTLTAAMPVLAAPKQMSDGNMFDAEYYATSNPDVAAVFGTDENMLYSHYVNCGKIEGRKPFAEGAVTPKFDAVYYAKNNPDVVAVLGTGETMLYNHYINCGKTEGRIPCEGGVPFMEVAPLETQAQPEVIVQSKVPQTSKSTEFPYELYKLYDNGTYVYFYTPESDGVTKPQHWYDMGYQCGDVNMKRFATYSDFMKAVKREWSDSGYTLNGEKIMKEARYYNGPIRLN